MATPSGPVEWLPYWTGLDRTERKGRARRGHEDAHARNDEAVFATYGWPPDLSDEELLENLLTRNLQRSDPE